MIIGLFIKHIKAYKGINFIPIGSKYKFVTYVGENGVGKSSILESLDSFFNEKSYSINKSALNDGINTIGNEPFVAPIFLIDKSKVTRQKKEFEKLSLFFWNIDKKEINSTVASSMSGFFELRDNLEKDDCYSSETHYLILAGESNLQSATPKLHFASFHIEEHLAHHILGDIEGMDIAERKEKFNKSLEKGDWKKFSAALKSLYSYVYFPVEIEVESFTKIETTEMQKIFDKKIKSEIQKALASVNFDKKGGINKSLDLFVNEIEGILNNEYCYDTGLRRNNNFTLSDLVNNIIEVYFQKRTLHKKDSTGLTKVSELSSGEKRQALINLVYAFLKRESDRDKEVIIGIDEPESSLHTSLCYDQFEKLKEISSDNQILITTHWYGFLPIVSEGYGHFLNSVGKKIIFESYDLYDYRSKIKKDIENSKNQIPANFVLKSTYDLVQSIFYSLQSIHTYNWIICEGVSEKVYFEHFFKKEIESENLRILPMGGQSKVIRLYKYLEIPMKEESCQGRVYCLVDTDKDRCEDIGNGNKNLKIMRLSNKDSFEKTHLLTLDHKDSSTADIEESLDPDIFQETINELTNDDDMYQFDIVDNTGNSSFIKNLKNLEIGNYFKLNEGENKVIFAKKYVEAAKEYKDDAYTPNWISEIKKFFG